MNPWGLGRPAARSALAALLVGWTGLTVLRQVDLPLWPVDRYARQLSVGVPVYRFFGPNPGVHDRDLLVRGRLADGTTQPWRRLDASRTRRIWHMIWAPHRRFEKSISDSVNALIQAASKLGDVPAVRTTIPYLSLLNLATHGTPHDTDVRQVQFGLVNSCHHDTTVPPSLIFLSEFHDLPGSPDRDLETAGSLPAPPAVT